MFKNVAGQKVALFAFDSATGLPATGDAANLTPYLSQDFGAVTALTDTSATEISSTNAAGWYLFDVSQAETDADNILFTATSSTSGIIVVSKEYCTAPPNFTLLDIDGDGKLLLQDDAITADVIADAAIDAATFAAGAIDAAAIADGAIDAATFAAGAINAAAIADAAIDAATFAAGAIDAAAIATGAIDADAIADGAIDAATFAAGAIDAAAIADGAIDAATFAAGAIDAAAIATGAIDADAIADGAIDAATFAAGAIDAAAIADGAIDAATFAAGAIDAAAIATGAIDSDAIAFGAIDAGAIADGAIDAATFAADVIAFLADAIWDAAMADHLDGGTTGASLNGAGSAGDPWTTPVPGAYGAGTAGFLLGTNLDGLVSGLATQASVDAIDNFLDTEIAAIQAKTDNLPSDPADASVIAAEFVTLNTKLDTIDNFVDTEVAAIKAKTDNLPSDPADASDVAAAFATVNSTLATIANYVDTEVAAIKAKTDNLPSDPADASVIAAEFVTINTKLDTIDNFVDTEVAAIKAKTDQLTFSIANRVDAQVFGIEDNVITADATAADFVAEINVQPGLLLMFAAKGQTTLRLAITNAGGQDVYFVVWSSDGSEVFDFDDNTFKALGDAVTPYVLATEVTEPAGLGQSWYHAAVDMTDIAPGLAPADITVEAFAQNDVTPELDTDSTLAAPVAKRVRFGMLDPQVSGRVTPIFKRDLDTWEADFTVLADGQPVSFEGTGELSVRVANGTLLFPALSSDTVTDAVDGLKHLRFTQEEPGFTGDRDYSGRVVLTEDAVEFVVQDTFQILA